MIQIKLSEIDDFDRMDYQKRKSDALGSKSIGPLVLESPEPAQQGGLKRAHTHSPMSEVEGTANKNSYPNSKRSSKVAKLIVPPRLQSSSGPGIRGRSSDWLQSSSGPVDTTLRLQSSSGPVAQEEGDKHGHGGLPSSGMTSPNERKMAIRSSPGAARVDSAERERNAK